MIGVAIVGAGGIGNVHANALKEMDNAELVAVVDVLKEKGEAFAKKYGARYYSVIDDAMKDEEVDAVVICTPTVLHAEMAAKAANAKKHIICEKPLAMNLEEAERMIKAVSDNNVKAMAGHVVRFWPAYYKVKQMLEKGEYGRPLHVYSERLLTMPPWVEDDWDRKERLGGGVAYEVEIHDADAVNFLLGNPRLVKSHGAYGTPFGGWMHLGTTIEYENGVSALIQVGWGFSVEFPYTNVLRVVCEEATIEWIFRAHIDDVFCTKKPPLSIYKMDGTTEHEEIDQGDSFVLEWKDFTDCITSNKQVENSSFEDGREALMVVLASMKSAKEGGVVHL